MARGSKGTEKPRGFSSRRKSGSNVTAIEDNKRKASEHLYLRCMLTEYMNTYTGYTEYNDIGNNIKEGH